MTLTYAHIEKEDSPATCERVATKAKSGTSSFMLICFGVVEVCVVDRSRIGASEPDSTKLFWSRHERASTLPTSVAPSLFRNPSRTPSIDRFRSESIHPTGLDHTSIAEVGDRGPGSSQGRHRFVFQLQPRENAAVGGVAPNNRCRPMLLGCSRAEAGPRGHRGGSVLLSHTMMLESTDLSLHLGRLEAESHALPSDSASLHGIKNPRSLRFIIVARAESPNRHIGPIFSS